MKYDLKILQEYINRKLLSMQVHPTLPLRIYKYSQECVFSRAWDDITLNMRGTVLDNKGNQISYPFPKFFNLEELDSLGILLPNEPYTVYDKVDGSLIEVFYFNDELVVTSAGSFDSPQSNIAKKILYEKYSHLHKYFRKDVTYLFELIYPLNKIVLDYGSEEKLILLAMRTSNDYEFGPDYNNAAMLRYWKHYGFDVAEEIDLNIEQIKEEVKRNDFLNKEGFVVVYENGFRVKIKYKEYFRLHKIVSNVNEKFVWEFISQGKPIVLDNIPDETFQFIKDTEKSLQDAFNMKWKEYNEIYEDVIKALKNNVGENFTKKDFALLILPKYKKFAGILFFLYEKKYDKAKELLWKKLKPKFEKGHSGFQSMKIEV